MLVRREQESKSFPQLFQGSLLGGALVSYWPIVSLSLVRIPEVYEKFNSAQLPSRF